MTSPEKTSPDPTSPKATTWKATLTETTPPENVRRVACVGAGVIGGGWVAHFLARGYDVTAWDPAPDAAQKLRRLVDAAWRHSPRSASPRARHPTGSP